MRTLPRVIAAATLMLFGFSGTAQAAHASATPPWTCGRATLLAANPAAHLSGMTPVPHLNGTYTPVLLVHGWNGHPDMWWHEIDHSMLPVQPRPTGSLASKLQQLRGAAVYTLDYHDVAGEWFTNPGAGGPLYLAAVRCLLASPAFSGQKLIVVAHSMGGLIARWAVNTDPQIRARTGLVVTFGTPYDGSWLSEAGFLVTSAAAVVTTTDRTLAYLVALVHLLKLSCDASPSAPGCAELQFWLSEADSGLGFSPIGGHMASLAGWPTRIKFETLGGDIRLDNAPAELFGGLPAPGALDLGDGVVGTSSYGDGGTPTRMGTCRYTASALRADVNGLLGSVGLQAATDQPSFMPLAAAMFSGVNSTCGHVNEARLIQLTNEALGAVADAVTSVDIPKQLTQRLVPDPPAGPDYRTSGDYLQVAGMPGLDAINAALRNLIVGQEAAFVARSGNQSSPPGVGPGIYDSEPDQGQISATSAIVSVLTPVNDVYPGGNDGEVWVSGTFLVPLAQPVTLPSLFTNPSQGMATLAAVAKSGLLAANSCVRQAVESPYGGPWASGFDPAPGNYRHFALTPAGITIGFDNGMVAEEACGRAEVTISWDQLRPYLSPLGNQLASELR
jgi:pimeloyl-ACP methyl ester carboxylesterase